MTRRPKGMRKVAEQDVDTDVVADGPMLQGSSDSRQQVSYIDLTDDQYPQRLRFRKDVVTELCHLLQPDLESQTRLRTALSVASKVTIALNFYTNGSFQGATADISNIFQFATHRSIRQVTDTLKKRRRDYISFPMTREKQLERATGFFRIAGFPRVEGAKGYTHVALRAPLTNPETFRHRKGYHSLNVQLECAHKYQIMVADDRYPGSSHDAFILWQTNVPGLFQLPNEGRGWLLGDKGYLLSTWIMTSLRNTTIPAQHSYNESHATTRNIIEQTIGILKQRFCYLDSSGLR
uniref:putative nuclease HARBI1 n=1 Tax=Pristiophorus japonicus TaxID=55135 RepID=UPI00398E6C7F